MKMRQASNDVCGQLSLEVERLEARQMLAADVSVRVNGDDVTVIGSNEADEFQVSFSGIDGSITIAALPGSDTTIMGSDKFVTGLYSIDRLTIRTRGGDDRFTFRNTVVTGQVRVSVGSAENRNEMAVNNGVEFGSLRFRGGAQTDYLTLGQPKIFSGMNVSMGGGGDLFIAAEPAQLGGSISVRMGGGDDNAQVRSDLTDVSRFRILGNGGEDNLRTTPEIFAEPVFDPRSFESIVDVDDNTPL